MIGFKIPAVNLLSVAPEIVLTVFALAVLLISVFSPRERQGFIGYISLFGLIITGAVSIALWNSSTRAFSGMIALDNFSLFFDLLLCIVGIITVLISMSYIKREGAERGEYCVLLLFSIVGMMIMASATDLITIFMGLETFSIAVYVLAGFLRHDLRSNESALKYFLLGAFSSCFFLYGIAIVYAVTGSTSLREISDFIKNRAILDNIALIMAVGLLIVGFGFKIASVPFHMWTPDVYEGAPTPVTAFMSVGVKMAAFAGFVRVFLYCLPDLSANYTDILWGIAVATMTLGNLSALVQNNIKRLLAYSSIAHAGYIMVAMVAGNELGKASILFYLLAYAFMNLGAFAVVIQYGRRGEENLDIRDYAGMGFKYPLLGAAMAVFLFSLAGIPPTAGFVGKFYIFSAAVKAGYIWLTIIGVLNSAVAVYYYLRITVMMYMREPTKEAVIEIRPSMAVALAIATFFVLVIGIFPSHWLGLANQAIKALI